MNSKPIIKDKYLSKAIFEGSWTVDGIEYM